jgi:hypothetical protein
MIKKFFKHLHTVNKHRFLVFKLSIKAGIPFRGLIHDLSKYGPTEFFESVKYYAGDKSPIRNAKLDKGYSKAWLHHKGRNKHHFEYWYDKNAPIQTPIIPYKYAVEMVCDTLAAGLTYQGKNWTKEYQLSYYNNRTDKDMINENIQRFLKEVYEEVAKNGINKTINRKNLKRIYYTYVK